VRKISESWKIVYSEFPFKKNLKNSLIIYGEVCILNLENNLRLRTFRNNSVSIIEVPKLTSLNQIVRIKS